MYCENCGEKVNKKDNFCPNCGRSIDREDKTNVAENIKGTAHKDDFELNKYQDVVNYVFYSEKEILSQLRSHMISNGLFCKQMEIKIGENHTSGSGVLLGSDVMFASGGGTSEQKKYVWNPFLVKSSQNSPYAIKMTVIETSKMSKKSSDVTYEGRNLRVIKELWIDYTLSGIGCLLSIIPLGFFGLIAFAIGELLLFIIGVILAWILYKIGSKITEFRLTRKQRKLNELLEKVNNILKFAYQDIINKPF
ncbi:MAG: zinc-ribbon domain-containing protein [Halanaerobium sp.]